MIQEKYNWQEKEDLREEFKQLFEQNRALKIAFYAILGTASIYVGGKFFVIAADFVVSLRKFISAFKK